VKRRLSAPKQRFAETTLQPLTQDKFPKEYLMDAESQKTLARLLRAKQSAALGALRDGAPLVSTALDSVAPDFSAFYIHISHLALHAQCILKDPRVSLMIGEMDTGADDPQN
jgi:putative heme iron utilization protein